MTGRRVTDRDLLETYLDDHVAGATVGVGRVERMAAAYAGTPVGELAERLTHELREEREFLVRTTEDLGFHVSRYKVAAAVVAERLGRLKPNGRVLRGSPLSALLECELLSGAVMGKRSGWRSLRQLPQDAPVDRERLATLEERAERQVEDLSRLLDRLRVIVLSSGSRVSGA